MQNFSEKEKEELLKNPNVKKITEKTIEFTNSFKIHAIKSYQNGKTAKKIFQESGINLSYFKLNYASYKLKKWLEIYKKHGENYFSEERRGSAIGTKKGRPKKVNADKLTYEELQALVEIQQGVIEELKKRKALAMKK